MPAEASDDYFRSLSSTAGVGVIATDEQFLIRFCNEAAASLLGRTPDDWLGKDVKAIVPPERVDLAQRVLERIVQTHQPVDFEFRYPRQDGRILHLAVTLSPIRKGEQLLGVSVVLRDATRQIALLRDMAQAQKMAALESMAGAVAHHFNNILGGAITTADFALASDDPELHKRTLGITITALSRANEMTRALLAFAEGEHTDKLLLDVRQTLERYIAGIEPMLKARGIRLETDVQPVSLALPPKSLTQVLDRLIANAVEAMPTGGTLRIQLHCPAADQIVLRVSDTGPGISERILARIFEPFFTTKQAERTRSGEHPGLGLAVVHGIVKDLGGMISVTSAADSGTLVTVQLPAQPST